MRIARRTGWRRNNYWLDRLRTCTTLQERSAATLLGYTPRYTTYIKVSGCEAEIAETTVGAPSTSRQVSVNKDKKIKKGKKADKAKENFASTASRSSSNTDERDLLEVVEAYSSDQEEMDQNRPPPRAKNIMAKFVVGKSVPQVSKKTAAPAVPPAPKKVSGSSVPTSPRPDINSKEERRSKKDHERSDSRLAEKGKSPEVPPPQKKQKTRTSPGKGKEKSSIGAAASQQRETAVNISAPPVSVPTPSQSAFGTIITPAPEPARWNPRFEKLPGQFVSVNDRVRGDPPVLASLVKSVALPLDMDALRKKTFSVLGFEQLQADVQVKTYFAKEILFEIATYLSNIKISLYCRVSRECRSC